MGESLNDQERAKLKADAIKRLRNQVADLERSLELHRERLEQRGERLLKPPILRELFADAVRDLRRAGADVSDWYLRPPHLDKGQIDASTLLSDIKCVLSEVEQNPSRTG